MTRLTEAIGRAQRYLKEGFSNDSDVWFDAIADLVQGGGKDETLDGMLKLAKGAPTEVKFQKFASMAKGIKDGKIKRLMVGFVKDMQDGKFSREFRRMFGKTSQTSELFSFFKQAMEIAS